MPKIVPGGSSGWLGETNTPVANTLAQWSAIVSALRQLVGNANIASGSSESTDPLTAPFHLYYDWDIGRDTYVTGDFNSFESSGTDEEKIAQKLKRLRNQKLECGYSKHAPFKTLNRLVLEAYIITSLNWYTYTDERAHRDCVIIHAGAGPQPLFNHPGSHASAVAITAWTNGKVPTWQELIAFNDNTLGGVILPRGCSFDGEDLRKTSLVAQWAPNPTNIAADYSNIRCSLYITPDAHVTNFTFRDPPGQNQSLHLLYDIGFPSRTQLDGFYAKAFTALGSSANLSAALSQARASEYQTVGPFAGSPGPAWDTVKGSSPYPKDISSRSEWGRGGLFINGDNIGGLKSVVTALYTGVSLQNDVNCLQIYSGGVWVTPSSLQAYIDTAPNDRRINPRRAHCHLLVINDAFCSEVSVFGVGHTARARADLGGEIVSSNGNFTFGSCGALAIGYGRAAVPLDKGWLIDRIRAPLHPSEKTPAIRRITLGAVASHSASNITLLQALAADTTGTIPQLLAADGYSLPGGTYVWVENPEGDDWRALLTSTAWAPGAPAQINLTAALSQSGTNAAVPSISGESKAIGKSVYIRRVVDSRTLAERSASLELVTLTGGRRPIRSAILQTSPGVFNGGITRALAPGGEEVVAVTTSIKTTTGAQVTLRRSCSSVAYVAGNFYRKGVVVKALNKHFKAIRNNYAIASIPPPADWDEAYVHMPESYDPEDPITNEAPQIVFDTDTDPNDITTSCGINWLTIFNNDGRVRDQYRSGTDVLAVFALLRALGFETAACWAALAPRTTANRRLDPSSATDFPSAPSGGAASGLARWAVEFRRPTTITYSNFTYDLGTGHGNYSTALPAAQKEMSESNTFSLYFTNEGGGRVVVNGVNENGQTVTNRGLSDAETGETVLSGDLANLDTNAGQSFLNILINGLVGSGTWDLQGVASLLFPSSSAGSTSKLGPLRLAGAAALRSSNTASGSNDINLDTNINNSPDVVTLKGLNYWAQQQRVVKRRLGATTLYVVPNSANAIGQSFVFDGTSASLTLSPTRSSAAVLEDPPLTMEKAVTFASAIEYANAVFSEYETVNYQLANGPYWVSVSQFLPVFNHIANVIGATAAFPEAAQVASTYTSANTKPTTDVKAICDARPFIAPCFGTGMSIVFNSVGNLFINTQPLQLNFRYGGSVRAVCWPPASAILADKTNFPDLMYSGLYSPYRTANISLQNFLDNALTAVVPASYTCFTPSTESNIKMGDGKLEVRDVVFGGKSATIAEDTEPYCIFVYGNADVTSGGIYFLGNTTLASLPQATAKGINMSAAFGVQNTHSYISCSGQSVGVRWGLFYTTAGSGINKNKNFNTNCIHILDDNGNYALVANRAATNGTRGAAMLAFVGDIIPGSTLRVGGYSSWALSFTDANRHHGVAGAFGNYGNGVNSAYGILPRDGVTLARDRSYANSLWHMAVTGATLTSNVTLTSSPGTAQIAYDFPYNNALNLIVQSHNRGIDVVTARTVAGDLPNNRFFG